MPENFVIVGGGLAGARAAETIREHSSGSVTILAGEDELPYERPPLSKSVLLGSDEAESAVLHDEDWYAANRVTLRRGAVVTGIDQAARRLSLADGGEVSYGRLLIATGARPRQLEVPGADLAGVHTLRTMADSRALLERLRAQPEVVVVGAGWIGLEVAAAAREHGCPVTVVEPDPSPLHRLLGPGLGGVFTRLHEEHGVTFRFGESVERLVGEGAVAEVVTSAGEGIPAQVVVVGIGVVANTEVADGTDLEIDDGILVDPAMRTADPHIWAAGDVARWDNPTLGYPVRVEHWATANDTGPIAARSMVGDPVDNDVLPFFFSDQYDLGLEYVGHVRAESAADVVIRGDLDGREFVALWTESGRVLAGLAVNVWDTTGPVKALIRSRAQVPVKRLADPGIPLEDLAATD